MFGPNRPACVMNPRMIKAAETCKSARKPRFLVAAERYVKRRARGGGRSIHVLPRLGKKCRCSFVKRRFRP